MTEDVFIRFWAGSTILGELTLSKTGSTWCPKPDKPDNSTKEPDLEIDPFAEIIKPKGYDAVEIEKARPI
jgi:hypothetical protein